MPSPFRRISNILEFGDTLSTSSTINTNEARSGSQSQARSRCSTIADIHITTEYYAATLLCSATHGCDKNVNCGTLATDSWEHVYTCVRIS